MKFMNAFMNKILRRNLMFNEKNSLVKFKLQVLKKGFPAKNAVVFGDMYKVEGCYTKKCMEFGCERVLLIDTLETPNWLETRKKNPKINFYKGDFSNTLFMKSIQENFELGVVFDILLHQAPLLNTIHLMLEKITKRICIVQPMLREQKFSNTLIYLPGNTNIDELYPLKERNEEFKVFDVNEVNLAYWIWGMTPSFLTSVLKGEGFEIIYSQEFEDSPNKNWFWWGCVAERKYHNMSHWSNHRTTKDLYFPNW